MKKPFSSDYLTPPPSVIVCMYALILLNIFALFVVYLEIPLGLHPGYPQLWDSHVLTYSVATLSFPLRTSPPMVGM